MVIPYSRRMTGGIPGMPRKPKSSFRQRMATVRSYRCRNVREDEDNTTKYENNMRTINENTNENLMRTDYENYMRTIYENTNENLMRTDYENYMRTIYENTNENLMRTDYENYMRTIYENTNENTNENLMRTDYENYMRTIYENTNENHTRTAYENNLKTISENTNEKNIAIFENTNKSISIDENTNGSENTLRNEKPNENENTIEQITLRNEKPNEQIEQPTIEQREQPTTEQREQPTIERKQIEQPTIEQIEQPTIEQKQIEQPTIEQKQIEQPTIEQKQIEQPTIEQIEQPTLEQKQIEQPTIEQKQIEQPTIEQKQIEQPTIEQIEQLTIEQIQIEQPTIEQIEQPTVEPSENRNIASIGQLEHPAIEYHTNTMLQNQTKELINNNLTNSCMINVNHSNKFNSDETKESEQLETQKIRQDTSEGDSPIIAGRINIVRSIQGEFHQAAIHIFGRSSGKQCTPNSLVALTRSKIKPVKQWDSKDLDTVLRNGDALYKNLRGSSSASHDYIDVNELPTYFNIFDKNVTYKYGERISVALNATEAELFDFNCSNFSDALNSVFQNFETTFITFGDFTIAVGSSHGTYFMFDSHSRDKDGRQDNIDGKSVLIELSSISDIEECFKGLLASMQIDSLCPCEITGVNIEITDEKDDLVITDVTNQKTVHFTPINLETQKLMCNKLGYPFCEDLNLLSCKNLENKFETKSIQEDGNCFFRAISYNLSGSESCHNIIRKRIVEYIKRKKHLLKSFLRPHYKTVTEYLQKSKMTENGTWATEMEIQATAGLLNMEVFTFSSGSWINYSPTMIDKTIVTSTCAIYLHHKNNNHYDVVISNLNTDMQNATIEYDMDIEMSEPGIINLKVNDIIMLSDQESLNVSCNSFRNVKRKPKTTYSAKLKKDRERKRLKRCGMKDESLNLETSENNINMFKSDNLLDNDIKIIEDTKPPYANNVIQTKAKAKKVNRDQSKQPDTQFKYITNKLYREWKKNACRQKYQMNKQYRKRQLKIANQKYRTNNAFKLKVKMKYRTNEIYKEQLIKASRKKYTTDDAFKEKLIEAGKKKYMTNKTYKEQLIKAGKEKYMTNNTYKERLIKAGKEKYRANNTYKERLIKASKQKYSSNDEFKKNVIKTGKAKYRTNKTYKEQLIKTGKEKYRTNNTYKEWLIKAGKEKYRANNTYKERLIKAGKEKYRANNTYRERLIEASKQKYSSNDAFKKKLIKIGKAKYRSNQSYRQRLKDYSVTKYNKNESFKIKLKNANTAKYKTNVAFKKKLKLKNKQKYTFNKIYCQKKQAASKNYYWKKVNLKRNNKTTKVLLPKTNKNAKTSQGNQDKQKLIDRAIAEYRKEIENGLKYVCSSCCRLLFQNQVMRCNEEKYEKKGGIVGEIAGKCISKKYLHTCNNDCETNCLYQGTPKAKLWICYTCHRKIINGCFPAESNANNLTLESIPEPLSCLNHLEKHLISMHIPFMKVLSLPKGGQQGVHGPVVCVPSNIEKTTNYLPRLDGNDHLMPVKLKRKLAFKGYYNYDIVNQKHLEDALSFLIQNNSWYSDVVINDTWSNPVLENSNVINENTENELSQDISTIDIDEPVQNETEETSCIQLDSCLQPDDIGQYVLDQYYDEIINLAPAEGNNPINILRENGNEAKTFPALFPCGRGTFTDHRDIRLTLSRYFNLRLMNADLRFAQDSSYIFYSQYMSELEHVISSVSIACRKSGGQTSNGTKISLEMLKDKNNLQELLKSDQIYKFLTPIRGTPSYWQTAQKDLFAMVRQLGIPTWFCSFSSADTRWHEVIETILSQQNDPRKFTDLNWNDKCSILKSNPVTTARVFDHRFHTFLKKVILSDAQPIGKVKDYFHRIEFQQRGSPHSHCLFWIDNAPKFNVDDDDAVTEFIDNYVTCRMPSETEDPELFEIVTNVQQHSKKHSKTCKKKGTNCRFNFPRPPSERTFISRVQNEETIEENLSEKEAKQVIQKIWNLILEADTTDLTLEEIYEKADLSQHAFEAAANVLTKRNTVYSKRKPNEIWVNQYNEHLLRSWNANMDIQYVMDVYACIVYVISYISKAEREMGMLLRQTKNEADENNLDAQKTMRKLGNAYLNYREISAQESVYRVCNLRMKECSRKVQFIPIGENPTRMRLPLKYISGTEDDDIWMSSITDKYYSRPTLEAFETMSLATFCSEYRVLAKSQVPKTLRDDPTNKHPTIYKLQHDKGFVQKRTKTDSAVIRYPRFSQTKSPELYYQSQLELFLPHRFKEQLKPPEFENYEHFYETGYVKLTSDGTLTDVKSVAEANKKKYDISGTDIEKAENLLRDEEPDDAWAQLCPSTELERDECKNQATTTVTEDEITNDIEQNLPISTSIQTSHQDKSPHLFTKKEIQPFLCNLNEKQSEVFYKVRQWCIDKINGRQPKPLNLFITGGAGVGKSQLIKCIYYEATKLLSEIADNPDDQTVLLMAPTGTAAFNIRGQTIHSALSVPIPLKKPYARLTEDKLNTLRAKFNSLQIIIIDEISLVHKFLLHYVSERLIQIKRAKEDSAFGNISVITVGDFYQLPPVSVPAKNCLFTKNPSDPVDLWNDNFSVVELDEVMRQKDDLDFAHLLNRCRLKTKNEKLSKEDISMLKSKCGENPDEILQIYPTNDEVDVCNLECLLKFCSDAHFIEAEDFVKDKRSGQLMKKPKPYLKLKTNLDRTLFIGKGARVMLVRNINVSDGLVNGVIGTVVKASAKEIFVIFDNEKVGRKTSKQNYQPDNFPPNTVCIKPVKEHLQNFQGVVVRKQFPLKLSWACTVHKVQGLTLDKIVISLEKTFNAGQAYVALSRVTSKDGLYLKNIDDEKLQKTIWCDTNISEAVNRMPKFLQQTIEPPPPHSSFTILLHNIQGLMTNIQSIKGDRRFIESDYICLTETWLNGDVMEGSEIEIDQFDFHHKNRSISYELVDPSFANLQKQMHGGVGVYVKRNSSFLVKDLFVKNLEYLSFEIPQENLLVVVIYRPNSYPIKLFLETLMSLVGKIGSCEKCIIMGDFNQDILVSSSIEHLLTRCGYEQLVHTETTIRGTLIDHIYTKGLENKHVKIIPTFFSYHEALSLSIDT